MTRAVNRIPWLLTLKSYLLFILGLQLLGTYQKELEEFDAERQELANAEKLFDLPITAYPQMLEVQKQVSNLFDNLGQLTCVLMQFESRIESSYLKF